MSTFCRYKLETALYVIAERVLDFSHNFGNLKFKEEFHDIVLCICLLLYVSTISEASRKSVIVTEEVNCFNANRKCIPLSFAGRQVVVVSGPLGKTVPLSERSLSVRRAGLLNP
jgi:hypothetical protein